MKNYKSTQKNIRVIVLYNEVKSLPVSDEKAILTEIGARDDAEIIRDALIKNGYKADIFQVTEKSVFKLQDLSCDIFFNLCDGIGNLPKTEDKIPTLLDKWHRKYTGSDAKAMRLTTNKFATKKLFTKNKIPTPKFVVLKKIPKSLPRLNFPLIVKPAFEDCSTGIFLNSVVDDFKHLQREVERVITSYYKEALIEEYIEGKELNATMVGNGKDMIVFPLAEIIFGKSYDDGAKPKIIDFEAKWVDGSVNDLETTSKYPADIDKSLSKKIINYFKTSIKICGIRDYARIDVRLNKNNNPYILEINVNPDLYPVMGASKAAASIGLSYNDFIEKILRSALKRY